MIVAGAIEKALFEPMNVVDYVTCIEQRALP